MRTLIVLEELKKFLRQAIIYETNSEVREFAFDVFLKIQKSEIEIPPPTLPTGIAPNAPEQ